MIMVCDAIMGLGKTSAAITYMNDRPNEKFIYITPYLDEAKRIKTACPGLHFVEPSNRLKEYDYKKHVHTAALIKKGKNISTTHQAFKGYTPDMLDDIRQQEYTLIVDENLDVLEELDFYPDDLKLAVRAGYVNENNGIYTRTDEPYGIGLYSDVFRLMESRELIRLEDRENQALFFWTLPPDLLTSFKDVFILTYLFKGQGLHHLLQIYDIPYTEIGIEKIGDSEYRFCKYPGYTPEYAYHLKNMVDILYRSKLNDIGDDYHALSKTWFERDDDGVERLKSNVYNCFNNIWRDVPADHKLWGSYKGSQEKIKGKGYAKSFLTFNAKATNAYRDRECLVYVANVFMNVGEKTFYRMHGVDVDEDEYALSVMVQWLWRSAIRDGKRVHLYIPSKRMRHILLDWMDTMSEGGFADGRCAV